jgi:hypothetical protein
MIDNQDRVEFLIGALEKILPISAQVTPQLARGLSEDAVGGAIPNACNVVAISYMGDYGGIACGIEFDAQDESKMHIVSITHLKFNRKTPFFRDIDAYQRHRSKKIKKQNSTIDG